MPIRSSELFSIGVPVRTQLRVREMDRTTSLVALCRYLMDRYDISLDRVIGHADCKPTKCPGKNFPWGELRRRL